MEIFKWIKNNKYNVTIFVAFFVTFLIFANNVYDYGLHYDEVNRLNPLFPIFFDTAADNSQGIWSINIGNSNIPIVYKEYISSLSTFYMLPLVLFDNPITGLKTLYIIYFLVSVFFVYIYVRRFNYNVALLASIYLLINPLIYPDVFYGFSRTFHMLFLITSFYFFERYYKTRKLYNLFWGVFIICLGANFTFYMIWNIVALALTSLILDGDLWKEIIFSFKALMVAIFSIAIGLFNFVVYNLFNGFPTVKKLFAYIFNTKDFSMDGVSNESLKESLKLTLDKLDYMLNDCLEIYIVILGLLVFLWVLLASLKRYKGMDLNRHAFYPILVLLFTIGCILISPKPRFAYHWLMLSPAFELTLALSVIVVSKYLIKNKWIMQIVSIILCIFMCALLNSKIKEHKIAVEEFHLSKDYEYLKEYFERNRIDDNQILYFEWGIDAPIYFSSQGKIGASNKKYFSYMEADKEKIENKLQKDLAEITFQDIYVPLYKDQDCYLNFMSENVINFLEGNSLKFSVIESEWMEDINLYKIEKDEMYYEKTLDQNTLRLIKNDTFKMVPASFKGFVESVIPSNNKERNKLWGWCFLPDEIISHLFIIDESEKIVGEVSYGNLREDVGKVYPENLEMARCSGFSGSFAEKMKYILVITQENNVYRWEP